MEMLSKAQNLSLEDQRGPLNASKMALDIPDFLLRHPHSHSNHHERPPEHENHQRVQSYHNAHYQPHLHASYHFNANHHHHTYQPSNVYAFKRHQIVYAATAAVTRPPTPQGLSMPSQTTMPRSRSPIVIVYDNDDFEAPKSQDSSSHHPTQAHDLSNKSQISYVWVRSIPALDSNVSSHFSYSLWWIVKSIISLFWLLFVFDLYFSRKSNWILWTIIRIVTFFNHSILLFYFQGFKSTYLI